jgi:flavin-binding protein dodecin
MSMETLEFIIYPDGRVQEKATGIVGSSCTQVTAAIEAAIGRVVSQTSTEEFFAPEVSVQVGASNSNLVSW